MSQTITEPKQRRGFALLPVEKRKEIATKGGIMAHQKGTAHQFDSEEARIAGKLGGLKISRDREHMARIGRIGGKSNRASA